MLLLFTARAHLGLRLGGRKLGFAARDGRHNLVFVVLLLVLLGRKGSVLCVELVQ